MKADYKTFGLHNQLLSKWSCPGIVDILILEKKEDLYATNTISLSERISAKNH